MPSNAELCKTRDHYRVLFGVWMVVSLITLCNIGMYYNNVTDGGIDTVVIDMDIEGRPLDFGGHRAREMYYHLEELADEIYDDTIVKDQFYQSNFPRGESTDFSDLSDDVVSAFYDMQFHLSQKTFLFQQKLREFKDMWMAHYESTKSTFVIYCEALWREITSVFSWSGGDVHTVDMQRENVALRVQLVQLHQKHEFLKKQFHASDEEGYMVMMQQQSLMDELQQENGLLSQRIEGLLGTCQCGGAYHTRAAAVIDYELKQCTHALDQCLGHIGGVEHFDHHAHAHAFAEAEAEVEEYEHEEHLDFDEVEEGELPADFDVDEGACDFFMAVADACIMEKGEENCLQTFIDVRDNCPQFQ